MTASPSSAQLWGGRRHVGVVTETYPPEVNGVALTLGRLVDGLQARGHRVSLVRPRQPADDVPSRHRDPDLTLVRGVPLPGYRELRFGLPSFGSLPARWATDRPDVVYVATEGPLGWSAVRAARELAIPVLSGFHTNFHTYARHYHAGWFTPLVFRYLRHLHNATQRTLVASPELRARLAALGFERLGVLGRGVDSELFTPERRSEALRRSWGAEAGDPVVVHVGRLAPEKNLGLAIEAYRAMQRARGTVRLALIGDGPLRTALQRAHPDLHFCGLRRGPELAAHYASADVFLFPSETETFGNVTLEAMASGLAVVAYDYAAARMHIRHGESGVLVPGGRSAEFVEAAAALVRQPDLVRAMGRRARAHAARLGWPSIVERLELFITEVLGDCRTVTPAATAGAGLGGLTSRA